MHKCGHIINKPLRPETPSRIVKGYIRLIGLNPDEYSFHSLRSGFVVDQRRAGTPNVAIMRQTGHRSEIVMTGYDRCESQEISYAQIAGL